MSTAEGRTRVLWIVKGLGPGGAEQLLVQHARTRSRHRFAYRCCYLVPWKDQHVPDLRALDVPVSCLDASRWWQLAWVVRLREVLNTLTPDVVHVHSPMPAAAVRLLLRTLGDRPALIYTEHNRWGRYRTATRIANALTYPLDDLHIAVSLGVEASIPRFLAQHVEVVHHGIDHGVVREEGDREGARSELGIEEDEILVGTVANLRDEKDYPNLLAAAQKVCKRHQDARFVAVGQGPQEQAIRALHVQTGLGERFRLLGYRSDARRMMSAFDIFVLGSRHEGLPVAVMEALALGIPVVATAVGGLPEAVEDGVSGFLVAAGSPVALADAITELINDPPLRGRMAEAARDASTRFEVERTTQEIEALYAKVSEQRPGRRRPRLMARGRRDDS